MKSRKDRRRRVRILKNLEFRNKIKMPKRFERKERMRSSATVLLIRLIWHGSLPGNAGEQPIIRLLRHYLKYLGEKKKQVFLSS